MFWFKIFKNLIKMLHSEVSPSQIAGGAALGAVIGLTPFVCLHNFVVIFLILILNVNIGAAFLSAGVFGLIGLMTDPLAGKIGYLLLVRFEALTPLWTALYNMPLVPFTRFYNTIVLGSFVLSMALFIPVFMLTVKFVLHYRANWRARIENTKIMKILKLSSFYNIYDKYQK